LQFPELLLKDNQIYNRIVGELFSLADEFAAAMDSRAFSTVKNYLEYWQGRELGRIIKHLVEILGN
jgi:hypothetical protein